MGKRKKKIIAFIVIAFVAVALYQIAAYCYGTPVPEYSYCQEYIHGGEKMKGDIEPEDWEAYGPEFEIGANSQGYAVFKDPRAAMKKVCRDYKIGIWHLKLHNNALLIPFRLCYKPFVCYDVKRGAKGWREANFVRGFVDIYENSFEGDLEVESEIFDIKVLDGDGNAVENAEVFLYSFLDEKVVASEKTDVEGNARIQFIPDLADLETSRIIYGDYLVYAVKDGYTGLEYSMTKIYFSEDDCTEDEIETFRSLNMENHVIKLEKEE